MTQLKKLIDKMWEDPLRIGAFPKPVIVWNKKWSGMNWMCRSEEVNPYRDCQGTISCAGQGNTVQEAYEDWLEGYSVDIIYDQDKA
jgi:hypothetical protein